MQRLRRSGVRFIDDRILDRLEQEEVRQPSWLTSLSLAAASSARDLSGNEDRVRELLPSHSLHFFSKPLMRVLHSRPPRAVS
jgi:hypothetical protein